MTADRSQISPSGTSTRQKIIAIVFAIIFIIIIWEVYGLFKGSSTTPVARSTLTAQKTPGIVGGPPTAQPMFPQPAKITKPETSLSPYENEMLKMQQDTEARYISALNELQLLRLDRDIAETNKAIMSAKLDAVNAEKNIVNLLQPAAPVTQSTYAHGLINAGAQTSSAQQLSPPGMVLPPPKTEFNYTVISVSQVQHKWNAVIGFQGNLYSVSIGDFLPPDGSKVLLIDKSGVTLEKNNMKHKFSMVPII